MSKKISIKVTEAQPLPCPYCNGFYGYMEEHDLVDCCFDIDINIYGDTVNPCISIYNEVKS